MCLCARDKQVRKGRVAYESKIDLHDFTRDEAFPVLVRRLARSYEKRRRCVLVVTGKGANLEGVLRLSLPGWLADPSIRPLVAGYAQAPYKTWRHGGVLCVFKKETIMIITKIASIASAVLLTACAAQTSERPTQKEVEQKEIMPLAGSERWADGHRGPVYSV